jgi:hypothetical protein
MTQKISEDDNEPACRCLLQMQPKKTKSDDNPYLLINIYTTKKKSVLKKTWKKNVLAVQHN